MEKDFDDNDCYSVSLATALACENIDPNTLYGVLYPEYLQTQVLYNHDWFSHITKSYTDGHTFRKIPISSEKREYFKIWDYGYIEKVD